MVVMLSIVVISLVTVSSLVVVICSVSVSVGPDSVVVKVEAVPKLVKVSGKVDITVVGCTLVTVSVYS